MSSAAAGNDSQRNRRYSPMARAPSKELPTSGNRQLPEMRIKVRSLVKTMEKLERSVAEMQATTAKPYIRALKKFHLGSEKSQFELLISAIGAERTGRLMTEA